MTSLNERSVLTALLATLAMVVATLSFGCSSPVENGAGQEDAGGEETNLQDEDVDDFQCEPGEIVECLGHEDPGYEICNADGDGVELAECPGTAVCRDGQCVEVNCLPGSGRCVADDQPETCEPDGEGDYEFVEGQPCEGDETCEAGQCLDACGIAERTDSYIGCEYWAVETDNQLLHEETEGDVAPENRPPFAVVLANTQSDAVARVTVDGPDGEIAEAIPEREVHSEHGNPGDEWVTVYSETVDSDGDRIDGPHEGPIENVPLPPGATLTLLLPNQTIPFGQTTVSSTAYRVETTEPTVAYQFNPFCCNYNYTNDASMLMPSSALTGNYMMTSHAVWAREDQVTLPEPYSPTLSVVAMEPDTTVEVQLQKPVFSGVSSDAVAFDEQCPAPPNGGVAQEAQYRGADGGACYLYPVRGGDGIEGPDHLGRMRVTLDEHEVFNVAGGGAYPAVDLTGALVQADKEVAAFGAHTCVNVPFTRSACDHIESQLFPLETWGQTFIAAPHKLRNPDAHEETSDEGTYWKIVARDDNTEISTNISIHPADTLPPSGEAVPRCGSDRFSDDPEGGSFELNRGEYCEFGTREAFEVQATEPINIAGFMSGQNTVFDQVDWGDHAGDPSMHMVPPRDQYRTEYTFLVPPTYYENHITVIIQEGHSLRHNDEIVDPLEHDYHRVGDTGWIVSHIEVEPGPHHIESVTGIDFGLVVYGFDNYVSYAYTGGLDLAKDSPFEE